MDPKYDWNDCGPKSKANTEDAKPDILSGNKSFLFREKKKSVSLVFVTFYKNVIFKQTSWF